ncbi:hypothetical protein KY290_029282 [Solanum tuberosum]|uniref:Uncharacterized protein n=1 Tax=Solanum tuberosum TaxID=4113 RepID=A0ABQ7UKB2_SOLTU|nr:hypothetical protein KY290_029282 [Solanum tuberosum]
MNRYYSLEHNTDANVSIHCHTNECRTQVAWLNDYAPMGQAYFFESYTVASFNCGTKFPS